MEEQCVLKTDRVAQVFVLLAGGGAADDGRGRRVRARHQIAYEICASNGLTVIVHEDHKRRSCSEHLVSRGSKNEKPGEDRVCTPVRTLMFAQRKPQGALHRSDGARGRDGPQRHDQFRPHELFRDVPTSALIMRCSWIRPHGTFYTPLTRKPWTCSAAW